MSSTTGLSRTRSLRQPPATSRNQLTQRDGANNASESGSASPSRLPQIKPLTRSGTISGTTSSSSAASSAATARSRAASSAKNTTTTASGRPLSGIFSSKPSTTSTTTSSTTTATRQRAPTGPENATAARPLGRAPSIRQVSSQQQPTATTTSTTGRRVPSSSGSSITTAKRPTSSGGLPSSSASKTRAPTHTRAKSTATALTAATTLRPPISSTSSTTNSSVAGRGSPSSASTTSTVSHASRPSTTRLHARNASQSAAAAAVPQSPVASSRGQQQQQRPAFDTNQQHYSPLKAHAPKPLTSTFLAPPSPSKLPSNVAISAETSRLQTELLQLSLLHREAGAVTRQWHESARRKLGRRFKEAAAQHESVCARERDGVEARNVAALLRWGSGSQEGGRLGLEEKLQALDQILDGVWALSDPEGGRYGRVVEGFEAWTGRMANIMAKRRSGRADDLVRGDEPVLFVSDLDIRWKDECPGLVRKLEAWCLMLNEIGPAPDNNESSSSSSDKEQGGGPQQRSSLSRILEGCTSLVVDMLAELEVMLDIERDARRSEDDWIERMSEQLKIGDHETMDREPPLWKMVI